VQPPRLSIRLLMAIVAVIALNIAAVRVLLANDLYTLDRDSLMGAEPTGLTLQAGIYRATISRDRVRVFWLGFLLFGSMAMTSFLWGDYFCPIDSVVFDPVTGKSIVTSSPGSAAWTVWTGYGRCVFGILQRLTDSEYVIGVGGDSHGNDGIPLMTKAMIWFLPQLLISVAGGLFARSILGRSRDNEASASQRRRAS